MFSIKSIFCIFRGGHNYNNEESLDNNSMKLSCVCDKFVIEC